VPVSIAGMKAASTQLLRHKTKITAKVTYNSTYLWNLIPTATSH